MPTEATIPREVIKVTILDPPYERSGSGTPTIGMRPATIPILIIRCQNIKAVTPTQIRAPARSPQFLAILKIKISKTINMVNVMIPPIKPNSSLNTQKIKSECLSGKNCNWF